MFYMKVFFTMTMAAGFYETSIFLQRYSQAHSNSLVIIMKTSYLTCYSLLINLNATRTLFYLTTSIPLHADKFATLICSAF